MTFSLPPFDPAMFPTIVTFFPPGLDAEAHDDAVAGASGAGTVLAARVEPGQEGARRSEGNASPEATKSWDVFTPTQPPSGVDGLVLWNGQALRAITRPSDQSGGAGVLWRTECVCIS